MLAPAAYGGLESVVCALTAGLVGRGHAVHIAPVLDGAPGGHPFVRAAALTGATVHPILAPGRSYLSERRATIALCRTLGPDVVHTHGYRADVIDAPAARRAGFGTITTVHGFTSGDWRNRLYEAVQMRAFRRFDAAVAVSQPLAEVLARRGVPASRLRTIVNAWRPASQPAERAEARRALGVSADGFRVGFVGRLTREKGADLLIQAVARLHQEGIAVSVVGDGGERRALETLAGRLGVAEGVTWHGVVPDAGRLMRAFDVLVMPSRTEGTPIALFEAMAASVPVVAAAVGGVPDVVGDAGAVLVPADRPDALADAILQVRSDPASAGRRAATARRRLDDRFGEGPWLDAYERLYAEVAKRRTA